MKNETDEVRSIEEAGRIAREFASEEGFNDARAHAYAEVWFGPAKTPRRRRPTRCVRTCVVASTRRTKENDMEKDMNRGIVRGREPQPLIIVGHLPALGVVCLLVGILLESAHAYISWGLRAELAHSVGFFGIVTFTAGTIVRAKQYALGGQPIGGLVALGIFVSGPSFFARDWLVSHSLGYFAAIGQALMSWIVCGMLVFFVAPAVMRWERRRGHKNNDTRAWVSYVLVAIACQAGALWYELWQQPFVSASFGHPGRGYIEWAQVVADALGIWLGFIFAKWADGANTESQTP
jgi:hypothetical protein